LDNAMNWDELRRMADEERIKRRAYSLERDRTNRPIVLARKGSLWTVYYYERGEILDEHIFKTEDEAYTFLFNLQKEDPGTREG